MYAIVETSGRQYKIEKGMEFYVSRMPGKSSSVVKLKNILFAGDKSSYKVGTPYLKDAYATCEIIAHPRAKKVIAFKYKRRKSKKRTVGHRQDLTRLKVKEIKV